jgi:hypothetical protein
MIVLMNCDGCGVCVCVGAHGRGVLPHTAFLLPSGRLFLSGKPVQRDHLYPPVGCPAVVQEDENTTLCLTVLLDRTSPAIPLTLASHSIHHHPRDKIKIIFNRIIVSILIIVKERAAAAKDRYIFDGRQ